MNLIIVGLYLVGFFFVGLFRNIKLNKLKETDPKAYYQQGNDIVRRAFGNILKVCRIKCDVKGLENLTDETYLFVGNHRSYFDILSTHVSLNRRLGYVAKAEMLKIPFLRTWMRHIGALFLDRQDNKKALKTIIEGTNMLKEGLVSLYIFPEGTRGHEEEMKPFKKGSFKMAEKAKVPIVPIGIWKSDDVYENNSGFNKLKGGTIYINIGTPIRVDELELEDKKHIDSYVQNIVADLIAETRKEHNV